MPSCQIPQMMPTKQPAILDVDRSYDNREILRCIHIIRNITIRNLDSSRSAFLTFPDRLKELINSHCRFRFCMKTVYIYICIYIYIYLGNV